MEQSQSAMQREDLLPQFVESDPVYYQNQFKKIGNRARFTWTFNLAAAVLGPVWYGMRGLWNWGLPFIILETFAIIQLARGLFGDLGAQARARISEIEGTLSFRYEQLQAAIDKQSDKIEVFQRAIDSLEAAIGDIRLEAVQAEQTATYVALVGFALLLLVKAVEGVIANPALEKRFSEWLSDRTITSGLARLRTGTTIVFVALVYTVSIIHFTFPGVVSWLGDFPTDPQIRLSGISVIERLFDVVRSGGQYVFDSISYGIRVVLDGLEVIFVSSPWPVIASFIILLTWLSAGLAGAVSAACFLAYMGLFGFWEKAMTTLALLGTAALLSICLGIPLGFCSAQGTTVSTQLFVP